MEKLPKGFSLKRSGEPAWFEDEFIPLQIDPEYTEGSRDTPPIYVMLEPRR